MGVSAPAQGAPRLDENASDAMGRYPGGRAASNTPRSGRSGAHRISIELPARTERVDEVASSAGEIARGNLGRLLPPMRTGDEVVQRARSLDEMRLSLKDYINDLTATTAAKERLESGLKIARNVQMSFLPQRLDLPDLDVGIALAARLIPSKEVGDDLYAFFPLREHNGLFFAVGDVSGRACPPPCSWR